MAVAYAYTPRIWPPLVGACLLIVLSLGSWRRRDVPGALPLAVGSLAAALWLLALAIGTAAVAPVTRIAWHKCQAALQLPLVTATTCFVLEYVHPGRWLRHRWLGLLALPPLGALLLIATNDAQLFWRRLEIGPDGALVSRFATGGAILLAYGLGLIVVNTAVLLWLFIRSPQHRWPASLIVLGGIGGRAVYLLNFARFSFPGQLDPDVIAILFGWAMYATALYGFRLFDPLPAARRAVIEQLRDGVIVCDAGWLVVSLNPAAQALLGAAAADARGRPAQALLADYAGPTPLAEQAAAESIETCRGKGAEARYYTLDYLTLEDFRGQTAGYLLFLRDVTEREQAKARLLELQWVQATLQERELLAQELHDSLSQSLAFLNLQAQTTQLYLQTGSSQDVATSLDRLAAVAREIQGDTRALIGDLLAVSPPTEGFCSALRQAVERFGEQTGLSVSLEIVGDAKEACDGAVLAPAVAIQLLRIVQEALANVRRHAGHPARTAVRLEVDEGQLYLTISDEGAGFDPAAPPDPVHGHYGLQIMRQRAARVGGEIAVESAPARGTRVLVRAPLPRPRGRPVGAGGAS